MDQADIMADITAAGDIATRSLRLARDSRPLRAAVVQFHC